MVDVASLCLGCMERSDGAAACPLCGYGPDVERTPVALPERALLHERFYLGRLLGKPGGHGITYLAWDMKLETTAAIKEYLPQRLATRLPGDSTVTPHTSDEGRFYADGMAEFLREARTLVRFSHPNIVRVRDFFEENGSAYLVMDYYQGLSLAEFLQTRAALLPAGDAIALMQPVLTGLETVHASGYLHRDIKPANIYLADGTTPILLDFGAARQSLGEETESLSVVLTPGYAPFEQYFRKGKQGPWTDIYSCAATLYYMMSGMRPPAALDRQSDDELEALAAVNPEVSNAVSNAVMRGLALDPAARPASAGEFGAMLDAALAGSTSALRAPEPGSAKPAGRAPGATAPAVGHGNAPTRRAPWMTVFVALAVLLTAIALLIVWRAGSEDDNGPVSVSAPRPPPVVEPDQPPVSTRPQHPVPQPAPTAQSPSTLPESRGDVGPGPSAPTAALRTVPTPPAQPSETVPEAPPSAPAAAASVPGKDAAAATLSPPPRPGDAPRRGPPPGALSACAGAAPGAQCTVETPRGSESGRCREVPTGALACVPDHHRPGLRPPPR